MTREILTKVAKDARINLEHYDSVSSWINQNYTKVFICFGTKEYGAYNYTCTTTITKSVAAIEKASWTKGTPPAFEYTTQGWEYINDIK